MFNSWLFFCLAFVVMQVAFLQTFKFLAGRSKNIGALTVAVQIFSALFALMLVPLDSWHLPTSRSVWIWLVAALVFYAGADKLNAIARKNMDISTETMLHQVWKILFFFSGIIFLSRTFTWLKLIGGVIIVLANMTLFIENQKIQINKYTCMKFIAILCFTVAMTLDVNNSPSFNLPFYCFISFAVPALMLLVTRQAKITDVVREIKNSKIFILLLCGACCGIGAIAILRAYEFGAHYVKVAAISSVYVILNVIFAFIFLRERENLIKKLVAAAIIVCGIAVVSLG